MTDAGLLTVAMFVMLGQPSPHGRSDKAVVGNATAILIVYVLTRLLIWGTC